MDHNFLRAARAGNLPKVIEFINSGVDINVCNSVCLTGLHLAAKEGFADIVQDLIMRGANLEATTTKGNTPLHVASLAGRLECVKLLVNAGANVNSQSMMGFTPLYTAAQEDHLKVVKLLLKSGANQALATEDGFTPLAVALQQGHERIVATLLERDSRGRAAMPALHTAARKDDVNAADLLLTNPEVGVNQQSQNGFTPLHVAAHYGNYNVSRLLIDRRANVNFQAKNNITPLHIAAKWGRMDVCQLLLQSGALVDCRTRDGLTPLHCAARSGHTHLACILMDAGANPAAKTKNGLTPLHMAAQGDHPDMAQVIILRGASVSDKTGDMLTPLHVAAHCGNVRVTKTLLDECCDVNARALSGMSALHVAAFMSNDDLLVVLLLQHGAMVDQVTMRSETPLHLAARNCKLDAARALVQYGATVDARAKEDQTPFHMAVLTGYIDMINFLLSAGADPQLSARDAYTALHIAAKEGHTDVVRLLLDVGVGPLIRTKKDFIPLHLAAKRGRVKAARVLLAAQPNSFDAVGQNELTPLHVATHYNHLPIVELLLEAGADPGRRASNGYTALHIAAKQNHIDIASLLLAQESQPGQSANVESRSGFTPLHLAAQEGHLDMLSLLIQHGADPNHKSKNGLTPLHLAAQDNHVPVAQILVSYKADTSPSTRAGYTPLHTACHFGQLDMVRYLLSALPANQRPNVDQPTQMGFTPLHLATQQGHSQVVHLLLELGADANKRNQQGLTPAHIARRQHYVAIFDILKTITTTVTSWEEECEVLDQSIEQDHPDFMRDHTFADSDGEAVPSPLPPRRTTPQTTDSVDASGQTGTLGLDHTYLTLHENDDIWKQMEYTHSTLTPKPDGDNRVTTLTSPQIKAYFGEGGTSEAITPNVTSFVEAPLPTALTPQSSASFKDNSQLPTSEQTEPTADWELEAENVEIVRKPVTAGFLVSFLLDACGGMAQAKRFPDLRFYLPPNSVEGPTRLVCRLVHPARMPSLPPINDGDGFACRLMEFGPVGTKFNVPIVLEIPHYACLKGKNREIVILRSDNGESWREHPLDATDQAVRDSLGPHFDNIETNEDLHNRSVHRILTNELPQFFALVTRIRQELILIGPEGGKLTSSFQPQAYATFPAGSLTKKIRVGLQVHSVDSDSNDLIERLLKPSMATCSPIVTIEPRRRKFHKPITLTMPLPPSASSPPAQQPPSGRSSKQQQVLPTSIRLLCSITGGTAPAVWEDISGSSPLSLSNGSVSFTTTVSARLWLIDCRNNSANVVDLANRVYRESLAVPYLGRFVVYGRRHHAEEAFLRCLCLTDDPVKKTLEALEGFQLLATGPLVQIHDDHPHWIETAGNFVAVAKVDEKVQLNAHAFRDNRMTLLVRLKDADQPSVGKLAFMTQPRSLYESTASPPPKPISVLEVRLPPFTPGGGEPPVNLIVSPDYEPGQQQVLETTDIDAVGYDHHDDKGDVSIQPVQTLREQNQRVVEPSRTESVAKPSPDGIDDHNDLVRSDLDLRLIASYMGSDWTRLAPSLALSPDDIQVIADSGPTDEARAYAALCHWQDQQAELHQRSHESGTILARLLCDSGRRDIVEACMKDVVPVLSQDERRIAVKSIESADQLSTSLANGGKSGGDYDETTTSGLGPSIGVDDDPETALIVPVIRDNSLRSDGQASPASAPRKVAPEAIDQLIARMQSEGEEEEDGEGHKRLPSLDDEAGENEIVKMVREASPSYFTSNIGPDDVVFDGDDSEGGFIVPEHAFRCGEHESTWGPPLKPSPSPPLPTSIQRDILQPTVSSSPPSSPGEPDGGDGDLIIEPIIIEPLGLREETWGRTQADSHWTDDYPGQEDNDQKVVDIDAFIASLTDAPALEDGDVDPFPDLEMTALNLAPIPEISEGSPSLSTRSSTNGRTRRPSNNLTSQNPSHSTRSSLTSENSLPSARKRLRAYLSELRLLASSMNLSDDSRSPTSGEDSISKRRLGESQTSLSDFLRLEASLAVEGDGNYGEDEDDLTPPKSPPISAGGSVDASLKQLVTNIRQLRASLDESTTTPTMSSLDDSSTSNSARWTGMFDEAERLLGLINRNMQGAEGEIFETSSINPSQTSSSSTNGSPPSPITSFPPHNR